MITVERGADVDIEQTFYEVERSRGRPFGPGVFGSHASKSGWYFPTFGIVAASRPHFDPGTSVGARVGCL